MDFKKLTAKIKSSPNSPEIYFDRGIENHRTGRFQESMDDLYKAI